MPNPWFLLHNDRADVRIVVRADARLDVRLAINVGITVKVLLFRAINRF